jgi:hypothetical protein
MVCLRLSHGSLPGLCKAGVNGKSAVPIAPPRVLTTALGYRLAHLNLGIGVPASHAPLSVFVTRPTREVGPDRFPHLRWLLSAFAL